MDTFGVFLEDDIAVSPTLLLYADAAIRRWFYDLGSVDPRVVQYVLAQADGPVAFHYPGASAADDFAATLGSPK